MTTVKPTIPKIHTENLFALGDITLQGQYVNRQSGHLLIVDENIEKALKNGTGLFKGFIAKDPNSLEFLQVSKNPKQPIEEIRTAVTELSIPINF